MAKVSNGPPVTLIHDYKGKYFISQENMYTSLMLLCCHFGNANK